MLERVVVGHDNHVESTRASRVKPAPPTGEPTPSVTAAPVRTPIPRPCTSPVGGSTRATPQMMARPRRISDAEIARNPWGVRPCAEEPSAIAVSLAGTAHCTGPGAAVSKSPQPILRRHSAHVIIEQGSSRSEAISAPGRCARRARGPQHRHSITGPHDFLAVNGGCCRFPLTILFLPLGVSTDEQNLALQLDALERTAAACLTTSAPGRSSTAQLDARSSSSSPATRSSSGALTGSAAAAPPG